jgi:hypothetical protein
MYKGSEQPCQLVGHKEAVLFTGNVLSDRIQFGLCISIRVGKVCLYLHTHRFCVQANCVLASIQSGPFGDCLCHSPKGDSRSALMPHLDIVEHILGNRCKSVIFTFVISKR